MTLLAIDLGTNLGYAMHNNGVTLSGAINLKPGKFDGGGVRFMQFTRWLDQINAAAPVEEVVYEAVRRHIGTDAAHVYGGLMGVLTMWCEQNKIPYRGVPVATIKKFATGKGNASKKEVIDAVKKNWAIEPKSDDEADAVALLKYCLYEVVD